MRRGIWFSDRYMYRLCEPLVPVRKPLSPVNVKFFMASSRQLYIVEVWVWRKVNLFRPVWDGDHPGAGGGRSRQNGHKRQCTGVCRQVPLHKISFFAALFSRMRLGKRTPVLICLFSNIFIRRFLSLLFPNFSLHPFL